MREFIDFLQSHNELKIIDTPLDIHLEIPHLAYLEVKKQDSKALLFTNPISKYKPKSQITSKMQDDLISIESDICRFKTPVLMNIFGSFNRLNLIATKYNTNSNFADIESIAARMKHLLNPAMPKGMIKKLLKLQDFIALRHLIPKRYKGKAACQTRIYNHLDIDLFSLPILKTWEEDGGPFITMGQIYTRSIDSHKDSMPNNMGMYRLQVKSSNELIMHWQIHKDASHFFHEYKKANKPMPVSIAIGGDPLYTWCAQAPMPPKMFELMLYGMIRAKNPRLTQCISNNLSVPHDCDIIIEGYVDTNHFAPEGKFGDHTGFYTPIEDYPVLKVHTITMKQDPIYLATVVGKPPLEDKYMGYMTERLFLPLMQINASGLIDYSMPENGVFHNLILAKVKNDYPAQSLQMMHAFFGIGQMSFVKHAIFLNPEAPSMHKDFKNLSDYILDRIDSNALFITKGNCDALDHATKEFGISGKLGIDASREPLNFTYTNIDSDMLLAKMQNITNMIQTLHIYKHNNPIIICGITKKDKGILHYAKDFCDALKEYAGFFIFVDSNEQLDNYYMLIWRIVNSIDVDRDLVIIESCAFLDATAKGILENYNRPWPKDTLCTKEALDTLAKYGLLNDINDEFYKQFGIY